MNSNSMKRSENGGMGRRRFLRAIGCSAAALTTAGGVLAAGRPAEAPGDKVLSGKPRNGVKGFGFV